MYNYIYTCRCIDHDPIIHSLHKNQYVFAKIPKRCTLVQALGPGEAGLNDG